MAAITVTYYLDVISSWCFWAEPGWAELKARYPTGVNFRWKIALLDESGLPKSREEEEWFFRRSGTIMRSPLMLNAGWFDPSLKEYLAPNAIAEAGRDFGIEDDRIRLALAKATLLEGIKIGDWEIAADIGANLVPEKLLERARDESVLKRLRATTAEFHSLQVTQRPTFVIDDEIGDRAVFSGIATASPLVGAIEAMRADCEAYASHAAHYGSPPTT
jgi:predicted DsbA family dithiol-disulfide isomerase